MTLDERLEVFQDLRLRGTERPRSVLRRALLDGAAPPWRHARETEERLGKDAMVFERAEDDEADAALLFLLWRSDGYEVTNIVPLRPRELNYRRHNAVLQDFIRRVAEPASRAAGFSVEASEPRQSIADWLPPETADALRRFSWNARKSVGSHPMDREPWFAFLIRAHKDGRTMDAVRLGRWLSEVDNWPDNEARALAIEYEFALDLLAEYDRFLRSS
jgi:hypothetical protein